jgi:imidazolonepropionase-like amidohydrolase
MELAPAERLGRGVALRGTVWRGGAAEPSPGLVVVDGGGTVAAVAPDDAWLPADLPVLGGPDCWVGPGIVDAHVHLGFGGPELALAGGVVGVRDLGAPLERALEWRSSERPMVAVAGPVLTSPDGYPSQSWGAAGFAAFAGSVEAAASVVKELAASGVDLVKVALEPGAGWPVPQPPVVRALVEAAHDAGLPVTAHALSVEMVIRALDAGVDELAHTPVQRLPEPLVHRIAGAGIPVVSTLQTFFSAGQGRAAAANAADLHRAGVSLVYGTDLGNGGTRPGADPRELDRLADAGLGRLGALRAATETAAAAPGMRCGTGRIEVGRPAALVLLSGDPLVEPHVWRHPLAVLAGGRLTRPVGDLGDGGVAGDGGVHGGGGVAGGGGVHGDGGALGGAVHAGSGPAGTPDRPG